MNEWIRSALDLTLIVMVGIGVVQATRLIKHLSGLREGRIEMEKFVHNFNSAVVRAETGIRNLRQAARESGDDLEKLVDKAGLVMDELRFIVESADHLAERLSMAAASVVRPEQKPAAKVTNVVSVKPVNDRHEKLVPEDLSAVPAKNIDPQIPEITTVSTMQAAPTEPSSRAEKELLQALQKLK